MLDFGEIYWLKKIRNLSYEEHYAVVLGVDASNSQVLFQIFSSQIEHVFQFPNKKKPFIDVDAVGFLDYHKYPRLLSKDTGILMWHGVNKENVSVFRNNVTTRRYLYKGKLKKNHVHHLLVAIKCATAYRLSASDRSLIMAHYPTY